MVQSQGKKATLAALVPANSRRGPGERRGFHQPITTRALLAALCRSALSSLVPEGAGFPKMAADVSVTHRPPLSPEAEAEAETPETVDRRAPEQELPPLDPEEIRKRLEHTERQFRNRRKILIRGLPGDVTNQEVHDLLSDYELKYCFVDKYKGTAFVTLLNGEQAEAAINTFHQSCLRERELSVQLQPTDALLCVANLPPSLTQAQFEDLVRPFGSLERCFLVYSERTGHSKGYGFAEYMKKDSAARAKSDLLGKPLGPRTLYVHWTDAGQLTPRIVALSVPLCGPPAPWLQRCGCPAPGSVSCIYPHLLSAGMWPGWAAKGVRGAGVRDSRDGRGSTRTGRRPGPGWQPPPCVFLCPRSPWPKHAGSTHCCPGHSE